MQQKKNIRLLITLMVLLIITILVGIYKPEVNRLDIDKGSFSLEEQINSIDKITITGPVSDISLQKEGRKWSLNQEFSADPSKINDLLGVLSEVSVRRKVAVNVQERLKAPEHITYNVTLSDHDQLVRSFQVAENNQGTLTYFIDEIAYVVNIPGYNYHIADIFKLSVEDWRSPYVFASNWSTLEKMKINFSESPDNNFEIVYDNFGYLIPSIDQLDTTKMYDYMQQISFLQVQSYLPSVDSISRAADLSIVIKDVGDQQMILDFYIYENQTLGLINNQEWAIFDINQVNLLLKSPQDFSIQK